MPYLDVRALSSYYEISGSGPPLLLLHGGLCSLEAMRESIHALARSFRVHAVERAGHGRTPDRPGPYAYDELLLDTLGHMDALGLEAAHVVGFSDGGILGLRLALEHPGRVRSLVAVSANLDPGGFGTAAAPAGGSDRDGPSDARGLEDEAIERRLIEQHRSLSPDGADHADVVVDKLLQLWRTEPRIAAGALGAIRAPALVMAAEHDVVTLEHSRLIARSIPDARLRVIAGATHMTLVSGCPAADRVIAAFHAPVLGRSTSAVQARPRQER
jgi:pimeloyl-ACP methyl ester carboxylesterase